MLRELRIYMLGVGYVAGLLKIGMWLYAYYGVAWWYEHGGLSRWSSYLWFCLSSAW